MKTFFGILFLIVMFGFHEILASQPSASSKPTPMFENIEELSEEEKKEIFLEPDTSNRLTMVQKLIGASITSTAVAITTQVPYSIQLDVQARKPINLSPVHLYKGFSTYWAQLFSQTTLVLMSFEVFKGDRLSEELTTAENLGYSLAAGAISGALSTPFELKNTRARYVGYERVYSEALKANGPLGLLRGMNGLLLRDVVYGVGILGLPTVLKSMAPESAEDSAWLDGAAGLASGMLVGVVTSPAEYIRSQIQGSDPKKPAPSIMKVYRDTVAEKGIQGLMKGWEWRTLRIGTLGVTVSVVGGWVSDYQMAQNQAENTRKTPARKPLVSPPSNDRVGQVFQAARVEYARQRAL